MHQRAVWEALTHKTFTLAGPPHDLMADLRAENRILDVGCGYGRVLHDIVAATPAQRFGVDLAVGMLRRAQREGLDTPFAAMSADQLGLRDDCFDLVLLVAVLTTIAYDSAVQAVLAEAWRVLRPGGQIYIADFLIDETPVRIPRYESGLREFGVWGMFRLADSPNGGYARHFAPADLRRLVAQFHITDWQEQTSRSMNGNPVRSVRIAARKG